MSKIFLHPFNIDNVISNTEEIIPEGVKQVGAPPLWKNGTAGEGIVVAVIDSGCQGNHPDLMENIIGGYNFTDDDNGNSSIHTDYISHGTHVAGIIAASKNGSGIIGVAPKAKLLILKIFNQKGKGDYKTLIKALNYAIDWKGPNGETVSVINLSLGGIVNDNNLHKTIKKTIRKGIIIVAAAGNIGDNNLKTNEILYPGYYKEVIQVGAINDRRMASKFSNSNNHIDFVAPGEGILSTFPINDYAKLSGTSMAAPHVSGVIALLLSSVDYKNKTLLPIDIHTHLSKNAIPLGIGNQLEGFGLIHL